MILNQPERRHYDVIVVGSGPAGITTALELVRKSQAKVAIIESGALERIEKIQALAQVELSGELQHNYFPMHTQRRFGGSSTIWGGFCAPLEERAFLAQEWPIQYAELARWYPAASEMAELPENAYRRHSVPIEGAPEIVYRPFYLSPPVRFNEKYLDAIAGHPRIDLLLNNTCSRLIADKTRVSAVELRDSLDPDASPLLLSAERFVVACGGTGNPRLLQLSNIGQDLHVGAGLMEHPHLYAVARVYLDYDRIHRVVEHQANVVHALQLSNDFCLQQGVLSFSADFNLAESVTEPLLGRRQKTLIAPVTIRTEMPPDPRNRVSLCDPQTGQVDYLHQPLAKVDFAFYCEEPARRCWQLFANALVKSALGRPSTLAPELKPDGGGHLIGTTRMGHSAADSTVDANGKVHTLNNLYVAGSSVFPAGGASNPTFTIIAMSLRLGDHLAQLVTKEQPRA